MSLMESPINIFWFRRDLRIHDNTGLIAALNDSLPVLPLFIFDSNILDELDDRADARVNFIHQQIEQMNEMLKKKGTGMNVYYGKPVDIFSALVKKYKVQTVFTNEDYEPYAIKRDAEVGELLLKQGIKLKSYKDHVIFNPKEVLKPDEQPYTIFTPYMRAWKSKFGVTGILKNNPSGAEGNLLMYEPDPIPSLQSMGFIQSNRIFSKPEFELQLIRDYKKTRNFPGINGTSRLGLHIRFGTISIRDLVKVAATENESFLNELIWREFYQSILFHFPYVVGQCFKPAYEMIRWRNNEKEFDQWCIGQTGYPIVDAGMRELNTTGFMHNRVRMVTASFLTKHLLIDWRWGEAYFAKKLLDYELASNNGGWQWAAGCGCDAAPYFRIFNPTIQTKKFDPELKYIRKWVPELDSLEYPLPIVEHQFARERCLQTFKQALNQS